MDGELTKQNVDLISRDLAVKVLLDMANRYDEDIEGCDGEELDRYTEGIQCCFRLAYALKFGRLPKPDSKAAGDLKQQSNFLDLLNIAQKLYREPLQWPI